MKKILLYIFLSLSFVALTIIFLSTKDSQSVFETRPLVLSMTKSIEFPEEMEFAGEKVDLERYDMHERFDREINAFTYLHSTTLLLIKKANRYFPIIEPILKKNEIPDDFKYLAVIESSLNPRAVSPAGAAGLWQFMPKTAPSYGLEVGNDVDERYSVEKSTEAACKYFNEAYAKYGKWSDVALSYNAGQGRVTGEKDKQQEELGLDLWLVEETSRYYFRMLAVKEVMENPYKYGFVLEANQLYKPIDFDEVKIDTTITDLAAFAKENNISYFQLKDFNSWLRTRKLTIPDKCKKTYTILIPKQNSLYYQKGEKIKVHDKRWINHG